MSGTEEVCRFAINLARNCGYTVFPCREDKRPATPHGFKDASKDPAAITDLWRAHPGPLIGIACGDYSGLSVLDVDVEHNSARAWWHDNHHRLPDTFYCRTRSGGVHGYLQHSLGITCSVAKPVNGIDIRGQGGYVLHWPSAGFPILSDAPLAPFPNWLRKQVWPPRPPPPPPDPNAPKNIETLIRCVRDAQENARNNKLYWACHRMRDHGFGERDALRELLPAALHAGLTEIEIRRTIVSAWRA
jgi:hypothetical protein